MDLFPKTGKGQVLKQPRKSIDVASLATLEEEDFIEYPELEGTHTDDQVHISKCRSGRKEEEWPHEVSTAIVPGLQKAPGKDSWWGQTAPCFLKSSPIKTKALMK